MRERRNSTQQGCVLEHVPVLVVTRRHEAGEAVDWRRIVAAIHSDRGPRTMVHTFAQRHNVNGVRAARKIAAKGLQSHTTRERK